MHGSLLAATTASVVAIGQRLVGHLREFGLSSLALGLVLVIAALQVPLWIGEGSFRDVRLLRLSIEAQQQENLKLQARNEALRAEVIDLRQGLEALEERARSELGMIREGETFFHILPNEGQGRAQPVE